MLVGGEPFNEVRHRQAWATYKCLRTGEPEKSPYCIAKVPANAANGKPDESFVFAGSNACRCSEIVPLKSACLKINSGINVSA
jgi:hypothetical protein